MGQTTVLASGLSILAMLLLVSPVNLALAVNSLPTGITVFTKEKIYVPGQTVNLIGEMHSFSPVYRSMMITVFDPAGQPYLAVKPEIGNPFFDFSFLLNKDIKEGQWTAVIRYAADVAEAKFIVTTNGLDKAILGMPVTLNAMGNEMAPEARKAGKAIMVTADLDNDSEDQLQFAFIVQVLDVNENPVTTLFTLGSMSPLQTVNPSINWTPASGGTYTVNVFAWSSLANPVPLADKQIYTFEVYA
jgi:hypothetical protein